MEPKLILILIVQLVDCSEWVKLAPIEKNYVATENVLALLTPFDDTAIKFSENITVTNLRHLSLNNFMKMLEGDNLTENNSNFFSIANEKNKTLDEINLKNDSEGNMNISDHNYSYLETKNGNLLKENVILQNLSAILLQLHHFVSKIPADPLKKINVLRNIHDSILFAVDENFKMLWSSRPKRESRGLKDHTDSSSAETALMTIGFLTFAVYLIKLVLQIIYILKAKNTMMFTPMVTAAGRTFINDEDDPSIKIKIMKLMESFNPT